MPPGECSAGETAVGGGGDQLHKDILHGGGQLVALDKDTPVSMPPPKKVASYFQVLPDRRKMPLPEQLLPEHSWGGAAWWIPSAKGKIQISVAPVLVSPLDRVPWKQNPSQVASVDVCLQHGHYYVRIARFMPRVEIVHKHNTAARRLYIRGHNGKVRRLALYQRS